MLIASFSFLRGFTNLLSRTYHSAKCGVVDWLIWWRDKNMHPMRERERGSAGGIKTEGRVGREEEEHSEAGRMMTSYNQVEVWRFKSNRQVKETEREAGRRRSKERDAVSLFSLIQSSLNVILSFYSSTAFVVNFVNFLSIPFGTVQVCFFTLSCDTEKFK